MRVGGAPRSRAERVTTVFAAALLFLGGAIGISYGVFANLISGRSGHTTFSIVGALGLLLAGVLAYRSQIWQEPGDVPRYSSGRPSDELGLIASCLDALTAGALVALLLPPLIWLL